MTKRKSRARLPTWAEPRFVNPREKARLRASENYRAKRQALVDKLGVEVVREMERAAKSAAAVKRNKTYWASLSQEEKHARLSAIGKKGGGRPWSDPEAKRAHLAKLGRANMAAYMANETPEQRAYRCQRISEAHKRRKAQAVR